MVGIRRPMKSVRRKLRPRLESMEPRLLLAVFQVINTTDDGAGSLRQALFDSTTSPGDDSIVFALSQADPNFDPAESTWTISLVRPLLVQPGPDGGAISVDATTQPEYAGLGRPVVQLRPVIGQFTGEAAFIVSATGGKIRGFAINQFPAAGVRILGSLNTLEANYIGTNTSGDQALPNSGTGIEIFSRDNTVGGALATAANLISGNGGSGILIDTANAFSNLVQGNTIGTDLEGSSAIGNGVDGITISANNNTIAGNLVSGNKQNGIATRNGSNNRILSNRVGTNANGLGSIPNSASGILLDSFSGQSLDNQVGTLDLGGSNTIAFNQANGITMDGGARNSVLVNSIFQNNGVGIALLNGANNDQAAPVLTLAESVADANETRVSFTLQSVPNSTFVLRFFSNPAGVGNPQGQGFLGVETVDSSTSGFASGTATFAGAVPLGTLITATATQTNTGNTSPFSNAIAAVAPGDPFVVINTNDSGPGSLRQVILNANNAPGFNTVRFNIPGSGIHTISPDTVLPAIQETVSIDASTQPGFSGTPLVVVDGSKTPGDGFVVLATNTTIKNLVIQNFADTGIVLRGSGFSRLEGLYVGTNAAGAASAPNGVGILVENSPNVTIGGTTAPHGNLISGNRTAGVYVVGSKSSNTSIVGNRIGTNRDGTAAIVRGNGSSPLNDLQQTGVVIVRAGNNSVGGDSAAARNLISGNYVGVMIAGAGGNVVWGNYIGTSPNGLAPVGNIVGVYLNRTANNQIGGTQAGAGNVISGNRQAGIEIFGTGAGNQIAGNIIGLGADGRTVLRRGGTRAQTTGIFILNGSGNAIGGTSEASRNIISGNGQSGLFIQARNGRASGNIIQRNLIGLDSGQTRGPGNGVYGVVLYNAPSNTVPLTGVNANQFFGNPGGNVRDFRGSATTALRLRAQRRTRVR